MGRDIVVTGCAGFVGSHLVEDLLSTRCAWHIHGVDNLDPYYPRTVKESNISGFKNDPGFSFHNADIRMQRGMGALFKDLDVEKCIHLAAQAGVRYSLSRPNKYVDVNIKGTVNLLECCRKHDVGQMVFISSSSVYGNTETIPFKETDCDLRPISPYGVTKLAGEVYCRNYADLYGLRITALRFFTVYGPRQRPDMAIHKFMKNIHLGRAIKKFGSGDTYRDYTYVSDIVQGVRGAMGKVERFEIYNLGTHRPITLDALISTIEGIVGRKARISQMPAQKGDVKRTHSDISKAKRRLGYSPKVRMGDGLKSMYGWFLSTGALGRARQ